MISFLLVTSLSINAQCVSGKRGDPLLIIDGVDRNYKNRKYYLYFLPDQKKECKLAAKRWNNYETNMICACKQLKLFNTKDRAMLKCVARKNNFTYSIRSSVYYYYDKLRESCIAATKRLEEQWQ